MIIPEGFTEGEIVEIINRVANRLCRKFRFGYHGLDDIKQQARLFALEALGRYDGVRSLENFLWTHVKNHLSNFKRDNFERRTPPCYECQHSFVKSGNNNYGCDTYRDLSHCIIYAKWGKRNDAKKNLMTPIEYEGVCDVNEQHMKSNISGEDMAINQELEDRIDRNLPVVYRKDYSKLKMGIHVMKARREELRAAIKQILQEKEDENV